jgi:hypothetical protein
LVTVDVEVVTDPGAVEIDVIVVMLPAAMDVIVVTEPGFVTVETTVAVDTLV